MKIAFYINVLSNGGAERVVTNLANYLSTHNDVTIINSFNVENEYPLNENVKHIYMDSNEFSSKIKRNISRIKFLRRYIKTEKPDVILSFMGEPNIRLMFAKIGLRVKTIVSVRNVPKVEYFGIKGKLIARTVLQFASGCVFQTREAQQWFPKRLQKKSKIILNSVNPDFFNVSCNNERKNIVTCGRLIVPKNHRLLISAFNKVKDITNDNLILYGAGELLTELEEYANSLGLFGRVVFAGRSNNIPSSIKNAKIFVLSSNSEGLPNALMEAMALGLPCISTDCPCGGPREIIQNEKTGILVPVNDVDKMADALSLLLLNDKLRTELGKNAKEYAHRVFNPEIIYKEWEDYIYEVVKDNSL